MNIVVVGTGYVGLVSGACFAEVGIDVTCVDIDADKIAALKEGKVPIYEPGLESLVIRNMQQGRLHFTTNLSECIHDAEVVFCAVGTPPDEDGSADLSYVRQVAREFGDTIERYTIFVTKSTVPVGTSKIVEAEILNCLSQRGIDVEFEVASNPEFLKEGAAIKDFMSPDRVVIGCESPRARKVMERLYRPFLLNNFRVIFMDIASAEMTKYVGADVNMVRKGIGADDRIGRKFLYAGCGYGGSCFPKDVKALANTGRAHGYEMKVIEAVEEVNERQKGIVFRKIERALGSDLRGRKIAIWGLAFKPETDDMRCAPSLVVIENLLKSGASVTVYDPVAMDECRRRIGDAVEYARDMYDAANDADAVALLTEWKQFRVPSWRVLAKAMRGNLIVDGRNIYDPAELADEGFDYHCIGK